MNLLRNIIKGSNRLFGEKTKIIAIALIALALTVSYGLFFIYKPLLKMIPLWIGSLFWTTEFDILTVTDYSNIYMIYSKAY
jgi:hypothetical protein